MTMTDVDGDDTVYRAGSASRVTVPVALLVDEGTASAAELFAGCLQAHGRAVVVGARTYGKGVAQVLAATADGGVVMGDVARFTLPNRRGVHGLGIEPDLPMPTGEPGDGEGWCAAACRRLSPTMSDAVIAAVGHATRSAQACR